MAEATRRSNGSGKPKPEPRIRAHAQPADPTDLYDSNLRLALALINDKEWDQLASRTGIECFNPEPQYLSLFVELEPGDCRSCPAHWADPACGDDYRGTGASPSSALRLGAAAGADL